MSATGALAGQGIAAAVSGIRDTHRAIAHRVFWALGQAAEPVRIAALPARTLHDAISALVYGLTGTLAELAGRIGGELAALAAAGQEAGLRARVLQGVLNGMFGDRLAREGSPLATEMFARVDASRGPHAGEVTPRLVVFVHGLCETEDAWFLWRGRGPVYGERLRAALGYTPVYLRYNTGLEIAENGRRLAAMLEEIVAESPTPVEEIALVGHSMGGLVARQALLALTGTPTGARITHLVCLGTPHRGAPLEVAAEAAARVLAWMPETRPLADALGLRSAGIKDLRHGPGEPCALDVDHFFFSAGLGRGLESLLGDIFVHRHSAWDLEHRGATGAFAQEHYSHIGDATHFDLLGHPEIAETLIRWLGGGRLLEADGAELVAGELPAAAREASHAGGDRHYAGPSAPGR
ncbi:MAG TPA: alpha/beta fold hydrolase [Solirubrobacteraceae bacterium]|nr:alpha/beta fold hydrolase [Solirubrobacteraceae bacterium]